MGRPPCCDKVGIKKGPWTPEEDIILVSYIQEHGPGNWRSVPTNTGLLRCSKSCRLRWTNYLRPGIKRGNFTPHEEGMIIHLQSLLGNKWAAIASYLPQRTDNDIKNYWNTHLKKKLKKQDEPETKLFNDRKSLEVTNYAPSFTRTSTYASSTENISRLLEGWMRSSSSPDNKKEHQENTKDDENPEKSLSPSSVHCYKPMEHKKHGDLASNDEFESMLSFENFNSVAWENKSSCDSNGKGSQIVPNEEEKKQRFESNPPLSFLENWLLDENVSQVEDMMELSPMF